MAAQPPNPVLEAIFAQVKAGRMSVDGLVGVAVSHPDVFTYRALDGTTLLHWASLRGDLSVIDTCTTFGANVR